MPLRLPRPTLSAAIILLAAAGVWAAQQGRRPAEAIPLAIEARPVALDPTDPNRTQVGRLRYMGGLVLTSREGRFGGLSGLRVDDHGQFLAISDQADWVTFTTIEQGERLVGIRGGVIAPVLGANGLAAQGKEDGDAEALEWPADGNGSAGVIFEQSHRLQVYRGVDPADPKTLLQRPAAIYPYEEIRNWPPNGGGEAFADLAGKGELLISEEAPGPAGGRDALLLSDAGKLRFSYMPPQDYQPTDAVLLAAPATVLVLNRKFIGGVVSAVVSEVVLDAGELERPGNRTSTTPVAGTEIARLGAPLTVDNMEGIAVRRSGGRTFVYLVSDDNFSPLQRTLLLKFELLPAP